MEGNRDLSNSPSTPTSPTSTRDEPSLGSYPNVDTQPAERVTVDGHPCPNCQHQHHPATTGCPECRCPTNNPSTPTAASNPSASPEQDTTGTEDRSEEWPNCTDCGHTHTLASRANICIGCACPRIGPRAAAPLSGVSADNEKRDDERLRLIDALASGDGQHVKRQTDRADAVEVVESRARGLAQDRAAAVEVRASTAEAANVELRELLGIERWPSTIEPANVREVAATEVRKLVEAERDQARTWIRLVIEQERDLFCDCDTDLPHWRSTCPDSPVAAALVVGDET